jgi:hypothetical protein
MKKLHLSGILPVWLCSLMLAAIVSAGCSKKPAAPPAATAVDALPGAQTLTSPPATGETPQNLAPSELNGKVAEALAALKAKDFKKAVDALTVSQDALVKLNADQLAAYNNAKSALARQVISAAAAGDPAAQAAMEKMRQDALYHR